MSTVPYNGYLQIWLQRVTKPKSVGMEFESGEAICKIVNGHKATLWNNEWIKGIGLKSALDVSKIVVKNAAEISEVMQPEEVELFNQNAWAY